MAKGKPGADSSVIVTSHVMGKGLIDLAKPFTERHQSFGAATSPVLLQVGRSSTVI